MAVQLALYKGKGKLGNALVRWWTKSPYSHCELVVGGICYSSTIQDGGVRCKVIKLDPAKWDVIDLPWADELKVLEHFDKTAGQPYGWIDLALSQVISMAHDDNGAAFCSEWCAAALGIPRPVLYSPDGLRIVVEFVGRIENAA